MKPKQLREAISKLWTIKDVQDHFGVSGMTIHHWRNRKGLPTVIIPGTGRATIRFIPAEVIDWHRGRSRYP